MAGLRRIGRVFVRELSNAETHQRRARVGGVWAGNLQRGMNAKEVHKISTHL